MFFLDNQADIRTLGTIHLVKFILLIGQASRDSKVSVLLPTTEPGQYCRLESFLTNLEFPCRRHDQAEQPSAAEAEVEANPR